MKKENIQNLIRDLIEKTKIGISEITVTEESPKNMWISVEVSEPRFFTSSGGEGLQALNHLVHRILEVQSVKNQKNETTETESGFGLVIDINGFQKKHVDNIRAIAHMMGERARYFKSSIEVDPMSPFERRIVHEFLSNATDLKTESTGVGKSRRVVIKYIGGI